MQFKTITLSVDDGIATLTLNRPDKLNAFNREMMQELIDAFDDIDGNDAVRACIVTGAGRAFCAGADLSAGAVTFDYKKRYASEKTGPVASGQLKGQLESADASPNLHRDGGGRVTLRIFDCLKPIIAAVNGPAVGIGATMLLPMDIRLASDTAKFGFVFARRGIVMEACSSWFLPRLVGVSQALEWTMTGRVFGAAEARDSKLVRSLHAPEDLLPVARMIAREIADNTSPVAVALNRRLIWSMLGAAHPMDAHRVDSRLIYQRGASDDAREGITSFLEKRPARFPGKVSADMPPAFPWETKREFN